MNTVTTNGLVIAPIPNIGAVIERTSVKFIRIAFVGDIDYESNLDYIELVSKPKNNNKIR
jgi:hypothetical protein